MNMRVTMINDLFSVDKLGKKTTLKLNNEEVFSIRGSEINKFNGRETIDELLKLSFDENVESSKVMESIIDFKNSSNVMLNQLASTIKNHQDPVFVYRTDGELLEVKCFELNKSESNYLDKDTVYEIASLLNLGPGNYILCHTNKVIKDVSVFCIEITKKES